MRKVGRRDPRSGKMPCDSCRFTKGICNPKQSEDVPKDKQGKMPSR